MGTRKRRRFWTLWALSLLITTAWTLGAAPTQTSQPTGGVSHGGYIA